MTTTSNFGLPIYGANDIPKWDDTNTPFQSLDSKVPDKTANNSFSGMNTFNGQVRHNASLLMQTGSLISSDDGVITTTAPSSDKEGTGVIRINDSGGNQLFRLRPIQHSNGKIDLDIASYSATNGGTITFNGVDIMNQGGGGGGGGGGGDITKLSPTITWKTGFSNASVISVYNTSDKFLDIYAQLALSQNNYSSMQEVCTISGLSQYVPTDTIYLGMAIEKPTHQLSSFYIETTSGDYKLYVYLGFSSSSGNIIRTQFRIPLF